jgi:hypothetical protein
MKRTRNALTPREWRIGRMRSDGATVEQVALAFALAVEHILRIEHGARRKAKVAVGYKSQRAHRLPPIRVRYECPCGTKFASEARMIRHVFDCHG